MRGCTLRSHDGLVINSLDTQAREEGMDRLLAKHKLYCTVCEHNTGDCTLHNTMVDMHIPIQRYPYTRKPYVKDHSNPFYTYDPDQCILCGRCVMPWLAIVTGLLLAGLLAWTTQLHETWRQHLFNIWLWLPLLLVRVLVVALFGVGLILRRPFLPLAGVLVMVSCAFCALVFTLFPWIVPPVLSITQTAAAPATQRFLLLTFALLVPVTLLYNSWVFRILSGKIAG